MKFKLSVCPEIRNSKEGYAPLTNFVVQEFDTSNLADIKHLFRTRMTSNRVWKNGKCEGKGYEGCFGTLLDFDDGKVSIEQFMNVWGDYTFILYTSTNHLVDVPSHGGVQERYRVFFPSDEQGLGSTKMFLLAGDSIDRTFPYSDPTCNKDFARKFFPNCGDGSNYECYVNEGSKQWKPVLEEEKKEKNVVVGKSKALSDAFSREDTVSLLDGHVAQIKTLTEKTSCYCPFCNDADSKSASAFVSKNKIGQYYIVCNGSGCTKGKVKHITYWEEFDMKEAVMGKFNCWYDAPSGRPATIEDGMLKYFVSNNDWDNFANDKGIPGNFKPIELPRMRAVFAPNLTPGYNFDKGVYNIFQKPRIEGAVTDKKIPLCKVSGYVKSKCPTISHVLSNIIEKDLIESFLNWLGYTLQVRRKPTTGWIISTENHGSGKELFTIHVLRPLFGDKQVVIEPGNRIEDRFNNLDSSTWLKVYDEVFARGDFKKNLARNELIKTLIGSEDIIVENKGVNKFRLESKIGYIFLTNHADPVMIEGGDRRYYFSRLEEDEGVQLAKTDWFKSKEWVEGALATECQAFADMLYNLEIDSKAVNQPKETVKRSALIRQSRSTVDQFLDAWKERDADWFDPENAFEAMWDSDGDIFETNLEDGFISAKHFNTMCNQHLKTNTVAAAIQKLGGEGVVKRVQERVNGSKQRGYRLVRE